LAILTITAASGQEWWAVEHSQRTVGNPWTTVRSLWLYDDGFLFQGVGGSTTYEKYYALSSSSPYDLFNNEGTLRILWIGAGLFFICSMLWDLRLLGLLMGGAAVVLGALSIVVFALGIGNAVAGSDLAGLVGIEDAGFFGVDHYELPDGADTVMHDVSYAPSIGFWLVVIALSLQLMAVSIRTFVVRESVVMDRASRTMGKGEKPERAEGSRDETVEKR
jgi:hypothetical protein